MRDLWARQFDRCCGKVPKPLVKPKPKTGLEKHEEEVLEQIAVEFRKEFSINPRPHNGLGLR